MLYTIAYCNFVVFESTAAAHTCHTWIQCPWTLDENVGPLALVIRIQKYGGL